MSTSSDNSQSGSNDVEVPEIIDLTVDTDEENSLDRYFNNSQSTNEVFSGTESDHYSSSEDMDIDYDDNSEYTDPIDNTVDQRWDALHRTLEEPEVVPQGPRPFGSNAPIDTTVADQPHIAPGTTLRRCTENGYYVEITTENESDMAEFPRLSEYL
jgi:hypothetical protein